jgi:hypothetical protein
MLDMFAALPSLMPLGELVVTDEPWAQENVVINAKAQMGAKAKRMR